MLLTIAAAHYYVAEKFAFEAHSHSYKAMGALFSRAVDQAQSPDCKGNTETYQALLVELGREALAENADWLQDHRGRTVQP